MLPTGHAAAGFLLAEAIIKLSGLEFTQGETTKILLLGAFSGFAPDLDMFWAFTKAKGLHFGENDFNHRSSLLHAPLLWLLLGLLVFAVFPTNLGRIYAVTLAVGSFSHFFLDSFKMGIRWLWPWSHKYFAFLSPGEDQHYQGSEKTFFAYWLTFLKSYGTEKSFRATFTLELIILFTAVATLAILH